MNGGSLCGLFPGNSPDWGPNCSNAEDSVFNNGAPCGGCQDVKIYWGYFYTGAYHCLQRGHYLLFMAEDDFNWSQPGAGGSDGFGQAMANNAASHRWTQCG